MLRLKMNTLEGEMMDRTSFDHPYQAGREFRLARDRGLAVTGHHMRIFGSNYDHWDLYWTKISSVTAETSRPRRSELSIPLISLVFRS